MLLWHMQNVVWQSCWDKQLRPWKRRRLDGSICCPKTCMFLSAVMVLSLMSKVLMMPWALTHRHAFTDADFWPLRWWWSVASLAPRTWRQWFNLKRGLVRPQHTFLFCISPSQMSSAHRSWRCFWMLLIYGFHLVWWSLNLHLWIRGDKPTMDFQSVPLPM